MIDVSPFCRDLLWQTHALCQGNCGLRPIAQLIPDLNDPPGLCDSCGGQTCNCVACIDHKAFSPEVSK